MELSPDIESLCTVLRAACADNVLDGPTIASGQKTRGRSVVTAMCRAMRQRPIYVDSNFCQERIVRDVVPRFVHDSIESRIGNCSTIE
jgi:hypothetical protein